MPTTVPFNVHATGYAGMTNGYDTLRNAAIALQTRNIVTNDEVIDLMVHTDQTITSGFDIRPGQYDATHYIRVHPGPGLAHYELNNSGAADYGTQGVELAINLGSGAVRVSHGVWMEGFRINGNNTNSAAPAIFLARYLNSGTYPNGVFDARITRCKIKHRGAHSTIDTASNASTSLFEDNIVINEVTTGVAYRGHIGTAQRNTFVSRGAGVNITGARSFAAGVYRDNVFIDCGGEPLKRDTAPSVCTNNFANAAITVGATTGFTISANLVVSSTDLRPSSGSVLIGAGTATAANTRDVRNNYRGSSPDAGAVQLTPAALPDVPNATVTSVTVVGQKVTISGTYTSIADSGVVNLSPAATPNGAVAKSSSVSLNTTAKTFTTTLTNVTPGNYNVPSVILTNIAGNGTSSGGSAFTIAVPAMPTIEILSQERTTNSVTLSGKVTGYPVSGNVTLPAAATPNGAVTKTGTLVIQDSGTFSVTLSSVTPGDYDAPQVDCTNFTGTATDTGTAMKVYAAGAAPQGIAAVILPAYSAPAFDSPSVGNNGIVTTVQIQNSAGTTATNEPFTFAMPFKKGQLRPQDTLIGKISGQSDVTLQFNVKATHEDGSVRHGVITGILPTLAANATVSMGLARSTTAGDYAGTPSLTAYNNDVRANATMVVGGVTYTASPNAAMQAGVTGTSVLNGIWLSGPLCTEYVVEVPFKDASNNEHPTITAKFAMRYYPTLGRARFDVSIENTKAYTSTTDVTYSMNIVCGNSVSNNELNIYNTGSLVHYALTRYRRVAWWNANPAVTDAESPLYVKHDLPYILDGKQLPNWDRTQVPHEDAIVSILADESGKTYGPMQFGPMQIAMSTTGGRPDIGLAPRWHAGWVMSQDKRLWDMMLRVAETSCSFAMHRRDRATSPDAPMKGHPLDVMHWPYCTRIGTTGDGLNPATNISEKFPSVTSANPSAPDVSHHPAFSYIPYMFTGDLFHLEEHMFWASYVGADQNPNYREKHKNLMLPEQVRGQAWSLRTWFSAKAFLPDNHPLKPSYVYYIDQNLSYYNTTYSENVNANMFGAIVNGYALVNEGTNPETHVRTWMDDYFTACMGFGYELGNVNALPILRWKGKFPVGRLIGPGFCWIQATIYNTNLRETKTSPFFTSWSQVYQATATSEVNASLAAAPCNSAEMRTILNANRELPSPEYVENQMMGYADWFQGYPAQLQTALGYVVDYGISDPTMDPELAWDLYETRALKPDFRYGNHFSVVPRTYTATGVSATAPGAPTNVVATLNANDVTVTFTAPASDGGSPITDYTVTASSGQSVNVAASPATFLRADLPKDVGITFTVKAANIVGEGPNSAASNSVTVPAPPVITVPSQPTGVSASVDGSTITVAWVAPTNDGGAAITGYKVTTPLGTTVSVTNSPYTTSTSGYPYNTAVSFSVKATNSVGDSAAATSNTITIPDPGTGITVPGAPTVDIEAGTASITVVVNYPTNTGGAPITSATVTLSTGETMTQSTNPFVFTGMSPVSRTATAYVTNSAGNSANSAASSSVTPAPALTVPTAPRTPVATAGPGSISLAFIVPASDGGSPILEYLGTLSTGETATSTTTLMQFNGLTPNVPRTATVSARNAIGTGPVSEVSNAVAPTNLVPVVTGVSIIPANVTLDGGDVFTFSAIVHGQYSPSQDITWTCSGGSINSNGLYIAPEGTIVPQQYIVTATSVEDPDFSAVAGITVNAIDAETGSSGVPLRHYVSNITNKFGVAIEGAFVTVVDNSTGEKATLWGDKDKTKEVHNPIVTDDEGLVDFYVEAAQCSYHVKGPGITPYTREDIFDIIQNVDLSPINNALLALSNSKISAADLQTAVATRATKSDFDALKTEVNDIAQQFENIDSGIPVAVNNFVTGGDGTAGNPWTGWSNNIVWSENTQYDFLDGYYAYATSPNFAKHFLRLNTRRNTVFVHTGTGMALTVDAGITATGVVVGVDIRVRVKSNSGAQGGMLMRGIAQSKISVDFNDVPNVCVQEISCILNDCEYSASPTQRGRTIAPVTLLTTTRRGTGIGCAGNRYKLIAENCTGTGVILDYCTDSKFEGVSQYNDIGVIGNSTSLRNTFDGFVANRNTTEDFRWLADDSTFRDMRIGGIASFAGRRSLVIGGTYDTINATGKDGNFLFLTYGSNKGRFNEAASGITKTGLFNAATMAFEMDQGRVINDLEVRGKALFGNDTFIVGDGQIVKNSDGQILIGTAVPNGNARMQLFNPSKTATDRNLLSTMNDEAFTATAYHLVCQTGGSEMLRIAGNGNVVNANNSYGAISDIRVKANIEDATPKLEALMQVRVVNYTLINDPTQKKLLGVISQELESIFPGMVETGIDMDGNEVKVVNYSVFVPILIKAVQELRNIVLNQ